MPQVHDPEYCWCKKCTKKLLAANDRYFREWVRKNALEQKKRLDELERRTSPHALAGYD